MNPVDPTQEEWRLVERAVGIDRAWNAAYQLVSTLEPAWAGPRTNRTLTARKRCFYCNQEPGRS